MTDNKIINLLFIPISIIIFIIIIFSGPQKYAYCRDNENESLKAAIGFGGLYGIYNANNIENNGMKWEPGQAYGGGLIFEKMITNTFGLHSGLWYTHYNLTLEFPDDSSGTTITHDIKSDSISMPVYLITSLSSGTIGFNILTGLNLLYIMRSRMSPGSDSTQAEENIQKYLGTGQIGAGGGFEFLFKITRFTRIFISVTGEYYIRNLITDNDGSIDHLYNATVRSGFMISTF